LNSGWTYRDQINQASAGLTVLEYYTQRYRHSSEQDWKDRLVAQQIWLDGCPAKANQRLQLGQQLIYHRSPWQEPCVPLAFTVLHEDADLLVIAKPAGLPVMPAGGFLEHTLLWQLKRQYPDQVPVPIHRLGRGTSGLVLLARSPRARSHLTQQMRNFQIGKTYLALASGRSDQESFRVEQPIGKLPHPRLGYVYGATDNISTKGSFARSDCRVLQRSHDRMLVEVTILTGRPHQIRIHLAAAGFPLVGDPLYGAGGIPHLSREEGTIPVPGDCGYFLHAYALSFRHPATGDAMQIRCPPPPTFQITHP
jgi:23S rRNA pseudouridine1911/1915/1917 synthase